MRRLVITLAVLVGILALADRGLAMVAANATADQVKRHEGLRERPDVTFEGFPFVTQAFGGNFTSVKVTARDVVREGLTIDRIDAHLKGVKVNLGDALGGKVNAVPVREGEATVRVAYGDLQRFLASKPGNIRIESRGGSVVVVTTFGIPGSGAVDVEGTPRVAVSESSIRVTVSNVRRAGGGAGIPSALAAQAAARASFTIPLTDMPFGIRASSAELTDTALVVTASARGLVIPVSG